MALSSGASGATGFTAFGTVGNKKHTEISLGKLHALNYNDLFLCIGKDYFLLSFDISLYTEKVIFACVESVSEVEDESTKKRKDKLANVCETRQYPCPVVKNELTSTAAAPSANTQTGISNTDTFMRAKDTHIHTNTHTHARTHINTHLEYSYNTLRHGRMRVK